MGLFLQTVIAPDCTEGEIRKALQQAAAQGSDMELDPAQCRYAVHGNGVSVLLNDGCIGFEGLAEALSTQVGKPVMLLYIYDGDFWGYFLCENGSVLDTFNPMPDYFEEIPEEQKESMRGNAALIADYFHVDPAAIEKYLVFWTWEDSEEEDGKAYEDDEFDRGEDWQMADFMRSLGYPYEW